MKCLNHKSEKLQDKCFKLTDYLCFAEYGVFRDTPAVTVGHEVGLLCAVSAAIM